MLDTFRFCLEMIALTVAGLLCAALAVSFGVVMEQIASDGKND